MPSIEERLQTQLSDRYAIERELGRGGMATVFLASDLKHDRQVAIKVLHPELGATIGADRFDREIRLAAKLQHPHILGLYDSGEADGLLYYVMPFVQGESLRDRLDREGQFPVDDALQIVREVADALGHAHSLGIVHRDIKPENILLSGGHALVADFGIARAASEGGGAKLTQTGMAVGTPVYMAPEQAMGEPAGPTADLYSLGCVLYEMLAGEPPFTAKTPQALMARHAMEAVPSIRIVRPTVPEEVEDAIFAAMAKVPADRPQTALQFTEFLGLPLGATASRRASIRATASRRVPTQATVAYRPPALPRPLWIVLGVIGGAAAIVLFFWWRLLGAPAPSAAAPLPADSPVRRVAVRYFTSEGGDPDLAAAADGLTEALIRSLSQVRAISVVSRNGVAPYRGTTVSRDSVARALRAGTVVEGTVELEGANRVRVTTRLYDGSGADLGKRGSFLVPRDQLFAAEDSVASEVARTLREWVGEEVQLRLGQARTRSLAAWTLYHRAERHRKDAEAAADPAAARGLLARADSLLRDANQADPAWIDPLILEAEIAYQQATLPGSPTDRGQWIDQGLAIVQRALALEPGSARALAARGALSFLDWRLARTADPVARGQLLDGARRDLETAVRADATLASAFAQLSFVYYADKRVDVYEALNAAREAYQADAYLAMADLILHRLFWASYDTDQFAAAATWCDEGRRRFPADPRFVECSLWLMLAPDAAPDITLAWRRAATLDSLTAPAQREFTRRLAQMIVGGVIGRAAVAVTGDRALADSADRVLRAARTDRDLDPGLELLGYEAIMRARMGQAAEAIALLRRYVAVNPDHSFQVGGNIHWWWRGLRDDPGFQAVMARR